MSKCNVPNWNLEHQRQEPDEEGRNKSSHVQNQQQNLGVPMSDYEVAELTWENGHLAMHGLGGLARVGPAKPAWAKVGDTLESIVHQATQHKQDLLSVNYHQNLPNINSTVASSTGKWAQNSGNGPSIGPNYIKNPISDPGPPRTQQCSCNVSDLSGCASASATFCRETDTTAFTWTSSESPGSLKNKSRDEDSALCGRLGIQDEELETKAEIRRSARRNRAAAIHNQSERRRRDKINQKMKALQKLVPNSSKTDKASMLDEVIEYLKNLQAQLQLMSIRNMPQMMMPLGMQQHLQMAMLTRMGMELGMGMGMLNMSPVPRPNPQPIPPLLHPNTTAAATFVPPPFMVPPLMATHASPNPATNSPIPMHNPFSAFLTQSMNVDFYNNMAELYRQQTNQPTQVNAPSKHMNPTQRD